MTTETTEVQETPNPNAELREYADRTKEENTQLRRQLVGVHLSSIGLDPATGLGKAIAKEYEGETDIASVKAYAAEEYGYGGEPEVETSVLTESTERIDDVVDATEIVEPPVAPDAIVEADAKLMSEDATAQDASNAVAVKMAEYRANRPQPVE